MSSTVRSSTGIVPISGSSCRSESPWMREVLAPMSRRLLQPQLARLGDGDDLVVGGAQPSTDVLAEPGGKQSGDEVAAEHRFGFAFERSGVLGLGFASAELVPDEESPARPFPAGDDVCAPGAPPASLAVGTDEHREPTGAVLVGARDSPAGRVLLNRELPQERRRCLLAGHARRLWARATSHGGDGSGSSRPGERDRAWRRVALVVRRPVPESHCRARGSRVARSATPELTSPADASPLFSMTRPVPVKVTRLRMSMSAPAHGDTSG